MHTEVQFTCHNISHKLSQISHGFENAVHLFCLVSVCEYANFNEYLASIIEVEPHSVDVEVPEPHTT